MRCKIPLAYRMYCIGWQSKAVEAETNGTGPGFSGGLETVVSTTLSENMYFFNYDTY